MTPGELVTALIRACEARDLDRVCSLVTDDIEYDNVPMGKVYGPEGVRKILSAGVTQEATDIEWRVLAQIEQGDTVMNERVDCFLVNDTWIEIPIAALFKVRDGKICLWRDYFDLDTYRKQRAA
ncbi:MAG: limonene-1,2-epoxide hydrolase family protein [Candidatus Nanopelagicales bacterium]